MRAHSIHRARKYNQQGHLTRLTSPLGAPTEQSWDALGHASEQRLPHPTGSGTLDKIGYVYDGQGQLKQVTDPRSLATTYTTDGLGNTTALVSPDTGSTSLQYDEAGNLKQKTDARGVVMHNQYDALNRLTQTTYTRAGVTDETVTFTWDEGSNGIGHLTTMTDASGQTQWTYDDQGHVLTRSQRTGNTPGVTLLTTYTYDGSGRLNTLTYPSGHQLAYSYNAAGQVSELRLDGTAIVTQLAYSPFGPARRWVWGNAQTLNKSFDANGRMSAFTLGNATRQLNWDAASRLTILQDQTGGSSTLVANAHYDNRDRLTSYSTASASYGYGYDATGNRRDLTISGNGYAYTTASTSNRLTNTAGPAPARAYLYDAAGNPTSDTVRSYVWSNSGRLKTVTMGGVSTDYSYNGMAQRVTKLGVASATYAYDEAGHILGEYDASGNLVQEHVWLGDTPVAMLAKTGPTTTATYYVFADQIDTPRAISDATGKIVWRWDGEAFGMTPPNEDPDGDSVKVVYPLRNAGQYADKESGLFYNGERYFDPQIGRFPSSDPIGLAGGSLSTYAYVNNAPMMYNDPQGLQLVQGAAVTTGVGVIILSTPQGRQIASNAMMSAVNATGAAVSSAFQKVKEWCTDTPKEECEKDCEETFERDEAECLVAKAGYGKAAQAICLGKAKVFYAQCLRKCDGK